MKIFGKDINFFSKKELAPVRQQQIGIPRGSFLEYAFNGGRVTASQAMQYYRDNSSVATAIDWIADGVEMIKPVLRAPDGTLIENHKALDIFKVPNPHETYQEYIGKVARHYLLTHNSFLSGLGNVKRYPLEMYAVKPQDVTGNESGKSEYAQSYMVISGYGQGNYELSQSRKSSARYYTPNMLKELYNIMGFSSRSNDVFADSPLEAIAQEIKQQISGRLHNLKILNQGGRLSLVFSFLGDDENMSDDEHQERVNAINDAFGGSSNAGKIAVLAGNQVKVEEFGKTNKDMDYAELDKLASHCIYMRYKIPLPLISTDASTFNNYQAAIEELYDNAIIPLFKRIMSAHSYFLLPRIGLDPHDYQFSYDPNSISALQGRFIEQLEKRRKLNVETINEIRRDIPNRKEIEGGDFIYQPANLVPVGEPLDEDTDTEQVAREMMQEVED